MGANIPAMGKSDIGKLTSNAYIDENSASKILRRTLLVKKLNTSRCTTPQELQERFDQLFELALQQRLCPFCRNARFSYWLE